MSDDVDDPFATPHERPEGFVPPPAAANGPFDGPFVAKPKKYRGGIVVLTIVIAMVATVAIISAMANLGASDGSALWVFAAGTIVTGILLVRSDTVAKRSVGLGLLWFLPIALIAIPVVGLVICLGFAASGGR